MAHYALVDENGVVAQVITGRNEDEIVEDVADWEAHYSEVTGYKAVRTSYNTYGGQHLADGTPFRKNYAGVGFTYHEEREAFIPPQPYDSWVLNEDTCLWDAPVPYPTDGAVYVWDEETGAWIEVVNETD
jgi:hypothetical protein